MNIKELLSQSLTDRFKADCVVKKLQEEICNMAERKTMQKYKDVKFMKNGLEFELIGVKAVFSVYGHKVSNVELKLVFAVSSKNKIPKEKRERVTKVKDFFNKTGYLEWNTYKVELWKDFKYEIELDKIISGEFNLRMP